MAVVLHLIGTRTGWRHVMAALWVLVVLMARRLRRCSGLDFLTQYSDLAGSWLRRCGGCNPAIKYSRHRPPTNGAPMPLLSRKAASC